MARYCAAIGLSSRTPFIAQARALFTLRLQNYLIAAVRARTHTHGGSSIVRCVLQTAIMLYPNKIARRSHWQLGIDDAYANEA